VIRAAGSIIYELVILRTFAEIGNDIGLGGNPTAWVTGCSVTPYADLDPDEDGFQLAAGDSDNCTGSGGTFTTPGGTRNGGSIEWTRGDGTIGSLNWDGPINTGSGSIYPGTDAVRSCAPDLGFRDFAGAVNGRAGVACPVVTADTNLRTPYVTSWTLSLQQSLAPNVVLDLAYVGNHGAKFISHVDLNQPDPANNYWGFPSDGPGSPSFAALCAIDADGGDNCNGGNGDFTDLLFSERPYNSQFPYLATITSLGNRHVSNYNGLQMSLTARNFHGLSVVSGYTWSKSLDIASGNGSDVGTDSYSMSLDYGRAGSDVRHRLTFAPTYNFPSVMGYGGLLDGWKVNANLKYQTGRGYDVGSGDFGGNGRDGQRWDFTGDPGDFKTDYTAQAVAIFHPGDGTVGDENPQAGIPGENAVYAADDLATFPGGLCATHTRSMATLAAFGCWTQGNSSITPPSPGNFGTMTRGLLSGPGFFGLDMSFSKRQQITERLNAEFRFEFFNILNHPAFAQPETGEGCEAGDCLLGQVLETPDTAATNPVLGTGGPRRVQMGVKLIF
jgi:hypothetical protein